MPTSGPSITSACTTSTSPSAHWSAAQLSRHNGSADGLCRRRSSLLYPERMPSEEAPVTGEPVGEKTPWQRVQNARHPKRPHTLDYVQRMLTDFQEIHGDRLFGDDPAIVCGMARLDGQPVLLVGEQKGRGPQQKLYRNFGMPKPEGYRKALRAMQLAA